MARSCASATAGETSNHLDRRLPEEPSNLTFQPKHWDACGSQGIFPQTEALRFPMTYVAQAHRPFPAPMEGNMDGAFFERILDGGLTSFYLIGNVY